MSPDCLGKLVKKVLLEIKVPLEPQVEMVRMEVEDPKETLANLGLQVCLEGKEEMVHLVLLALQVLWLKVKKFLGPQVQLAGMECQDSLESLVQKEKEVKEEIKAKTGIQESRVKKALQG